MTKSADPSNNTKDHLWQLAITKRLNEGRIDLAWHNFMNAALSTTFPCTTEFLRVLLVAIDSAAASTHHWDPIANDARGTMPKDELTFETSNKLENLLSRFVTQLPGETYILDAVCLRLLRLYKHYGESKSHHTSATQMTGNKFPQFSAVTSSSPV
jgi:hypothetical protein